MCNALWHDCGRPASIPWDEHVGYFWCVDTCSSIRCHRPFQRWTAITLNYRWPTNNRPSAVVLWPFAIYVLDSFACVNGPPLMCSAVRFHAIALLRHKPDNKWDPYVFCVVVHQIVVHPKNCPSRRGPVLTSERCTTISVIYICKYFDFNRWIGESVWLWLGQSQCNFVVIKVVRPSQSADRRHSFKIVDNQCNPMRKCGINWIPWLHWDHYTLHEM